MTPKNLDTVGVHLPRIQQAFGDNVVHLPCIWLAFAHIGVQSPTKKSVCFLPSLLYFFYHRKWFSEICRADFCEEKSNVLS